MSPFFADMGPMLVETDIDDAAIVVLKRWMPQYLTQVESERDLPIRTLARPVAQSFANTIDEDEFLDHQLPAIIVTTGRTDGAPEILNDDMYAADWRCVVTSIVRGRNPKETRWLASLFGGTVRRIMVHNQELNGVANGVRWTGSEPAAIEDGRDEGRYLAGLINNFIVTTDSVVKADAGPVPHGPYPEPDPDDVDTPLEPLVEVAEVTTAVVGVPITETPGEDG